MARIVGGFATSHILFPPDGVEEQAERVFLGMMELRRRVRALEPDLLILAGSDHLNNFSLAMQVTLGIGVADEWRSFGDSGLPTDPWPGARQEAQAIASHVGELGYDLVQIEEARPDHGMTTARFIVDPALAIPTIPLWINTVMPLPPSPKRSHGLGRAVRDAIVEALDPALRVVVVGHGGLSHWLAIEGEGRVGEAFDRHCLAALTEGRGPELAQYDAAHVQEQAGNGGLEVMSWLFMAGALNDAAGEILYYEPIPQWMSGMGGIAIGVCE